MAHPKIAQEELVTKLFDTFREYGYDGASLMLLSEITGLKKASLYHRFPEGKDQMVEMVLAYVDDWIRTNLTEVLQSENPPEERLQAAFENIAQLYDYGKKPCILRSLSLGTGQDLFQTQLQKSFTVLMEGFKAWLVSINLPAEPANRRAEDVIIRIQGALVLAGAMNNPAIFERTLRKLHQELSQLINR